MNVKLKIRFRNGDEKIVFEGDFLTAMKKNAEWLKKAKKDENIDSIEYIY